MNEEYVAYAGRHEPRSRLLRALPLIAAGVLGAPFLAISVLFSWQFAQLTKYIFDLGTSSAQATGLVLMSLSAGFAILFWIACLFFGSRRSTWKWRIWWAVGAFLSAAAMPIWWKLAGFI